MGAQSRAARHRRYSIAASRKLAEGIGCPAQALAVQHLKRLGITGYQVKEVYSNWREALERQQGRFGPAKPPPGQERKERQKPNTKPQRPDQNWICTCGKANLQGRSQCWYCRTHISKGWLRWY